MGPPNDDVNRNLPGFLQEYGFRVVEGRFDEASPGSAPVVLENDKLRVRFVPERGPVSAELAARAQPEHWHPLMDVLEAMGEEGRPHSAELSALAGLVKETFPGLTRVIGPNFPAVRRRLETLGQLSSTRRATPESTRPQPIDERSGIFARLLHAAIWVLVLWLVVQAVRHYMRW